MQNRIWTIFHRTGRYSLEFAPEWRRFVCWGGMAESVQGADGNGNGKNRLTLRIRSRFAILRDEQGAPVTAEEAEISPGDLVTVGETDSPGEQACWRITAVTAERGSGLVEGIVITAE